jgi:hypothetical protein
MKCPTCQLINPDSALRCDCGYDFQSGRMEQPYQHAKTPVVARITYCARCKAQNHISAAFCQACGAQFLATTAEPARRVAKPLSTGAIVFLGIFGCLIFGWISSLFQGNKTMQTAAPAMTPFLAASTSSAAGGGERMVLDNARVTAYVECVNREYKQYKVRFIVKKPDSPLLAPILSQAGNPKAYSVFVNGVDTGDDFAFSPNIAAFNNNGDLIPATFVSRPLNGNVALGQAYHDLVVKYEGWR